MPHVRLARDTYSCEEPGHLKAARRRRLPAASVQADPAEHFQGCHLQRDASGAAAAMYPGPCSGSADATNICSEVKTELSELGGETAVSGAGAATSPAADQAVDGFEVPKVSVSDFRVLQGQQAPTQARLDDGADPKQMVVCIETGVCLFHYSTFFPG